jgi:hypothetical protein
VCVCVCVCDEHVKCSAPGGQRYARHEPVDCRGTNDPARHATHVLLKDCHTDELVARANKRAMEKEGQNASQEERYKHTRLKTQNRPHRAAYTRTWSVVPAGQGLQLRSLVAVGLIASKKPKKMSQENEFSFHNIDSTYARKELLFDRTRRADRRVGCAVAVRGRCRWHRLECILQCQAHIALGKAQMDSMLSWIEEQGSDLTDSQRRAQAVRGRRRGSRLKLRAGTDREVCTQGIACRCATARLQPESSEVEGTGKGSEADVERGINMINMNAAQGPTGNVPGAHGEHGKHTVVEVGVHASLTYVRPA